MPSSATMLPKKSPCETGELLNALLRCPKFAPSKSHTPSRTGRVAMTAIVKKPEMTTGGERGSSRKM